MKKSDGGKGSSPRPYSVSQEEYAKRWDMIFGRDLDEEPPFEEDFEEEDDDSLRCVRCGGVDTMYKSPNGMHLICDQCGYAERILASEDY
jgi:hypothetical protein